METLLKNKKKRVFQRNKRKRVIILPKPQLTVAKFGRKKFFGS